MGKSDKKKIMIVKRNGNLEEFDPEKIKKAVISSAERVMVDLTDEALDEVVLLVKKLLNTQTTNPTVEQLHSCCEAALEQVNPLVAKSYREYRDYKKDIVHILDKVYKKAQVITYIGDKECANMDSALVTTQRCLIYNSLNKELYKKFFLTPAEIEACKDGYIYIHDMSARRDTMNCCLFDMAHVLKDGFEMSNIWYTEPKGLQTAFNVMGDVIINTTAMQYGGFTVPEVDTVLKKYAKMTYDKYVSEYLDTLIGIQLPSYKIVDSECDYVTFFPTETEYNVELKIHFPEGLSDSIRDEIYKLASEKASNPHSKGNVINEWSFSENNPKEILYQTEDASSVGCVVMFRPQCDTVYVTRYKW
mgnify:CR=1 FL=1